MKPEKAPLPAIANSDVVREDLPLPLVYYPGLHGTFLAFAQDIRSTPVLCACARRSSENLLRLRPDLYASSFGGAARVYFPDVIAWRIAAWSGGGSIPVHFVPGLCHRCNSVAPTLRYCDETDGDYFTQTYGWYINQAYLYRGMMPQGHRYLSEECPPEYRAELEAVRSVEEAFQEELARLLDATHNTKRNSFRNHTRSYGTAMASQDVQRMIELRHRASYMSREFKLKIEDMVRGEFGAVASSLYCGV